LVLEVITLMVRNTARYVKFICVMTDCFVHAAGVQLRLTPSSIECKEMLGRRRASRGTVAYSI
jgi:hypothetical protein